MSRAIRRASVSAPIATRSASAASATSSGMLDSRRPHRAIATCSSRPGSVSSTRHSSSMPRRHSPAAIRPRAAASRATGPAWPWPSPNCAHASGTSSSRPIATSASRKHREIDVVVGLDPAEALDRARRIAAEVALAGVAPRDEPRVLAPAREDPRVARPRRLAALEPIRAQRDRLVEPARGEQRVGDEQIDLDLIRVPGQDRIHRAAVQRGRSACACASHAPIAPRRAVERAAARRARARRRRAARRARSSRRSASSTRPSSRRRSRGGLDHVEVRPAGTAPRSRRRRRSRARSARRGRRGAPSPRDELAVRPRPARRLRDHARGAARSPCPGRACARNCANSACG